MDTMDLKSINTNFHFSERLKSNVMVASRTLDTLANLEPQDLEGGRRVVLDLLNAIIGEINIAKTYSPSVHLDSAERKILESMGNIRLSEIEKARMNLAETLSQITTVCNKYIKPLLERNLI